MICMTHRFVLTSLLSITLLLLYLFNNSIPVNGVIVLQGAPVLLIAALVLLGQCPKGWLSKGIVCTWVVFLVGGCPSYRQGSYLLGTCRSSSYHKGSFPRSINI